MGFDSSNNSLYEDLLKRCNGNFEHVVESKLNEDGIKQVDNEENKSYNL